MTLPISSGLPTRPIGELAPRAMTASSEPWISRRRSVWNDPGMTLLTSTPSDATSLARVRTTPATPARVALLRARPSIASRTERLVMVTMRPQRRSRIPGRAARMSRTVPMSDCSIATCQSASETSTNRPVGGPPAFATRISTGPSTRSVAVTAAAGPPGSAMSATTGALRSGTPRPQAGRRPGR